MMIFKNSEFTRSRTVVAFLALFVLAAGLSACGDKSPSEKAKATGDAVGDAMETTGQVVGDAAKTTGTAVGNAIEASGDFLKQSKDTDLRVARERLERLEEEWQEFLAKSSPIGDAAQAEFQNARSRMSDALAEARAKLAEAKDVSEESWREDAKPALDDALQKAQGLYEDTRARFGGK